LPPGEAGALVGFWVGCLPGVLEAVSPVTTHGYEHTFVVVAWQERGMRRFPGGMARNRMPDDVEPSQAELLRVEARHEGAGAIITVDGELDHSTAKRFVACILEVLDTKPRSITIDLHGVTYTDSSGLSALLRARNLALVDQVAFRIKDPSPGLRRRLELTATKDLLMPDE
jgi:anti-sigma B factor antagonist